MSEHELTRRTLLGTGGAGVMGVGLLALAGCSSSSPASSAPDTSAAPDTTAAPTPAVGSSAASGAGETVAALSAVPVGGSISAKLDGKPIVVSQQAAGQVAAFTAICTHMGCTVNSGGPQLHCPCHGSVYNAFTGAVVKGPAPRALTAVAVKVDGANIVTT